MRQPDYDKAATLAMRTLLDYNITTAPVVPMPIFKSMSGVLVLTFAEISSVFGIERSDMVTLFGDENQDAVTAVRSEGGNLRYIVTYNQRLPYYMLQRGLARELGHIVLRHDGTLPDEVRTAEAQCFAHHLLCPRPLLRAVQDAGIRLTVEVLGNMTGCYERCLLGMRKTPGAHVPPQLNRAVRDQFKDYIDNFLNYQAILEKADDTPLADFGTFMDCYEI